MMAEGVPSPTDEYALRRARSKEQLDESNGIVANVNKTGGDHEDADQAARHEDIGASHDAANGNNLTMIDK